MIVKEICQLKMILNDTFDRDVSNHHYIFHWTILKLKYVFLN